MSQLKFTPGSKIADLTLLSKVHSTVLYDTWSVLKQEEFGMKPYIAHIYKYTLGSTFPMKQDDLDYFCEKIATYNQNMQNENIRALPCFNSTSFSQTIPGGVVSYILFENPNGGYKLADICTPHCSKERICRYMLKDFIRGFIRSLQYSQQSPEIHDVNFLLAQNGFFYGKVPETKKGLPKNNMSMRNEMHKPNSNTPKDENRRFITLAYPKAWSAEALNTTQQVTDTLKKIKNKQLMSQFGKFLIDMYKGLDNSTNIPPTSPDDNFNPNAGVKFANLTDVFLNLNTEKDGNYSKFRQDDYFGVNGQYISAVENFLSKTLTNQQAFKKMDELLKGSFYEFIYKTVTFEISNNVQFEDFDKLLNHKFLMTQVPFNKVRSDTSFER